MFPFDGIASGLFEPIVNDERKEIVALSRSCQPIRASKSGKKGAGLPISGPVWLKTAECRNLRLTVCEYGSGLLVKFSGSSLVGPNVLAETFPIHTYTVAHRMCESAFLGLLCLEDAE
jgi:hypothetical protein